jgi:hypothetical protein
MLGLSLHHRIWWWRHFGWWDCPLREGQYTVLAGGVLLVHSSELQREGVVEWLQSVGLLYVRVARRPWEESLRNPTTGRYLEVLGIWARDAWPLGSPHAKWLIWRYA